MKKEIIIYVFVALIVGFLVGMFVYKTPNIREGLCRKLSAKDIISGACYNQGKNLVEFTVYPEGDEVIASDSDCEIDFEERYGHYPSLTCILWKVGTLPDKPFISDYNCLCWD